MPTPLSWGFSRYTAAPLAVKGREYARAELGYGHKPVSLVAASSLQPWLRIDFPVVRRVIAVGVATLPVTKGEQLGQVRAYQRGRLVGSVPLIASRSVARPGLAGRVRWYATRTLHHVGGWFT